ncbi:MAG: cell division protein FtsH, partial [Gemmatimonadota bacterium]|nr:cell division protein FtsH [Gemmatimonadota bacterium]
TVVSLKTAGSDPIHKVTIVPRGRALGLMMSLPEKDRYGQTKEWLIGRLGIAFGGRVAEELVFGPNKVTTGAGSDIEQATAIARRMVTQFGMSDKIGMMAVGDREQEIFLGREFGQRREVSERTAQMVDDEVKRFLDEAHERARGILTEHRVLLDHIAVTLLERETIDREDLDLIIQGKELPPITPSAPGPPAALQPTPQPKSETPQRTPILGAPPAEPMGA